MEIKMSKNTAIKWLHDFMREYSQQDNKATGTPYYYDLRYKDDGREEIVRFCGTVFFTEKAAEEYIQANRYNLPENVYAFLCWGGRNPELKGLLDALSTLTGVEYEK
ncbi:MAG: hypothetical protein DRP01_08900 [Archaeoglobales archaeon]|nr:MAG: hypothetical protein DRP01_08900 [Archaeoglobales archaeon]